MTRNLGCHSQRQLGFGQTFESELVIKRKCKVMKGNEMVQVLVRCREQDRRRKYLSYSSGQKIVFLEARSWVVGFSRLMIRRPI
jgi:hypothetical protein